MGDDNALWVPLLEKAFAKLYGNYAHIEGGLPSLAINALTGAPYDINNHGVAGDLTIDALWTKLVNLNLAGEIIMSGTPGKFDSTTNSVGIVQGHAYNVLDLKTLSTGQRLIRMFNPWS